MDKEFNFKGNDIGYSSTGRFKTSSNTYRSSGGQFQSRRRNGQFGADHSSSSTGVGFFRSEFELTLGSYNLGSVKCDFSTSGFSASLEKKTADIAVTPINKKLSQLGEGFGSPELLTGLKNTLQRINCDIDKVILKDIALEGPGVSAGISLGDTRIGAKANVQYGAVRLTMDTPMGDLVVKLKEGLGVGAALGEAETKSGKKGVYKEKTVSFGVWEVQLKAPDSQKAPTEAVAATARAKEVQGIVETAVTFVEKKEAAIKKGARSTDSLKVAPDDLLDATVAQWVEALPEKEKKSIHQQYQQADNHVKAFIEFQKEIQKKERTEAVITAGLNASIFLSQVATLTKDKGTARFAKGLAAVTQTFSGLKGMGQAAQLMGSGGSVLSGVSGLLGGAGLVLGAFSVLSSLFGDDDEDDGLGEALGEIHSAVMGMWSEMRESFEETWMRIDKMQETLDVMERNNWERFRTMMTAIETSRIEILLALNIVHTDARHNQRVIEGYFTEMYDHVRSYLEHMVDSKARETLSIIGKSELRELRQNIAKHSTTLSSWLTTASAITARSEYKEHRHGQLQIEQSARLRILTDFIAPERGPLDLKLGFFVSLTEELGANISTKDRCLATINPQDWCEVLSVYINIMQIAHCDIQQASQTVQANYFAEIQHLWQIANDTLTILDNIAHHETLWDTLVANYQDEFHFLFPLLTELVSNDIRKAEKECILQQRLRPLLFNLNQHYLQLVAFFHLIDPRYPPRQSAFAIETIERELPLLLKAVSDSKDGALVSPYLDQLLKAAHAHVWKEQLQGYLGSQLSDFDIGTLKTHLADCLPRHPLWNKMSAAKREIEVLLKQFDPLSHCVREAFLVHRAQRRTLQEAISNMETTLPMLMRLSGAADLPVLAECEQQLQALKQQQREAEGKFRQASLAYGAMFYAPTRNPGQGRLAAVEAPSLDDELPLQGTKRC